MEYSATFKVLGKHQSLGRALVEIEGGLLALHYGVPGLQGSIYWPRGAVTVQIRPDAETVEVVIRGSHAHTVYELAPLAPNDAQALLAALEASAELPDGEVPRRPVTLDHQWSYAEPWRSVRHMARDLARTTWVSALVMPALAPYVLLRLRREALHHAPEALEGFRRYAAGEFEAAREALRTALEAKPDDYDAFYLLLHTHLRQFAFDDALACAVELGMESKLRVSHLDNDIRLLQGWHAHRHEPLYYRETKDREGIGLIGQRGEALTMLRPAGKVRVGERNLSARTQGGFASAGATVTVIGWDGVSVIVEAEATHEIE